MKHSDPVLQDRTSGSHLNAIPELTLFVKIDSIYFDLAAFDCREKFKTAIRESWSPSWLVQRLLAKIMEANIWKMLKLPYLL